MYLPSAARGSEPLNLNFAAYNPKKTSRMFIIVLRRKPKRYDLRSVLEQWIRPVREPSLERGIFGLKTRKTIAYFSLVQVLSPVNEIGRCKLDMGKKSKCEPKALR